MRRYVLATLFTSLAALATAAAAMAGNAGFLPGGADSPNGVRVHQAFIFISIFTGIIFVAVEGALIVLIVKYRRGRRERTAEGTQIHGSTRLEIAWTVLPVLFLAAIGTFVFYKLPGIADAPNASAAEETHVDVIGAQFYWEFVYPNGAISVGQMVAPADQVVNESITAPDWDVIHSWWVPDFGGKYDAIPSKINKTWFRAPAGSYIARCYELCGIQHAAMKAVVRVVPREQYDAFIARRRSAAGTRELGSEEWHGVCLSCHRLDHRYIGPALGGNPLLADRRSLATILRRGQGQMPSVGRDWTPHQIDALVAYTKQFAKPVGSG